MFQHLVENLPRRVCFCYTAAAKEGITHFLLIPLKLNVHQDTRGQALMLIDDDGVWLTVPVPPKGVQWGRRPTLHIFQHCLSLDSKGTMQAPDLNEQIARVHIYHTLVKKK